MANELLKPNVSKLDLGRWPDRFVLLGLRGFLVALVVAPAVVYSGRYPGVLFAAFGLISVAAIPYALWLQAQHEVRSTAFLQFALDHLVLFGVIAFLGGVDSVFWLLFPAAILSFPMTSRRGRLPTHGLVSAGVLILAVVVAGRGDLSWPLLGVKAGLLLAFGAVSSFLLSWCRFREPGVDLGLVGHRILQKVCVGIVILDDDDMILQCNPYACELLGADEPRIIGRNFNAFRADDTHTIPVGQYRPATALSLVRIDGTVFPALYEKADLTFPESLEKKLARTGITDPQVVAFVDMSAAIQSRSDQFKAEHIEIIDNLLNTLADGIRNPVTAMTSAIQVLDKMEKKPGKMSQEELDDHRREIFDYVLQEANRLDKLIEYLVINPYLTPNKMEDLFQSLKHPQSE